MRMWRTRIGLIITLALVLIAFFGRYVAPYGEKEGIGVAMKPAERARRAVTLRHRRARPRHLDPLSLRRTADPDHRGSRHLVRAGVRHDHRPGRCVQPGQARRRADAGDGRHPCLPADHPRPARDLHVRSDQHADRPHRRCVHGAPHRPRGPRLGRIGGRARLRLGGRGTRRITHGASFDPSCSRTCRRRCSSRPTCGSRSRSA